MIVAYQAGDSVEGSKVSYVCRQFNSLSPRREAKLENKVVHAFRLSVHAEATVVDELDPKQSVVKPSSLLGVNDQLKCDTIAGFCTKVSRSHVVGAGAHRSTWFEGKGFAYAEIEISLRTVLEAKKLGNPAFAAGPAGLAAIDSQKGAKRQRGR